jgi:hypothetical protein
MIALFLHTPGMLIEERQWLAKRILSYGLAVCVLSSWLGCLLLCGVV